MIEKLVVPSNAGMLSDASRDKLLGLLDSLPNGVIRMEAGSTTSVRTSNNVAIFKFLHDTVSVKMLARSSSEKDLDSLQAVISTMAQKSHDTLIPLGRYAAWEPNFNSLLVQTVTQIYKNLFGTEMKVQSVHGGLECAVVYQQIPDAEIVSIGPTVIGPHAPGEAVDVVSVQKYWKLVQKLLRSF